MSIVDSLIKAYEIALRIYPKEFKNQFSEEMQLVFIDLVKSPQINNKRLAVSAFLRECWHLPGCIIRAYCELSGEVIMNTIKRNLLFPSIGFTITFVLIAWKNGIYRAMVDGYWIFSNLPLFLILSILFEGVLFGLLCGGAIAIALSKTKRIPIMLAAGLGYIIGYLMSAPAYWKLMGIPIDAIKGSWETLLIYTGYPIMGFVIGLMVGGVWRGLKAGLILAIGSSIIFELGYWANYLSWDILANPHGILVRIYPNSFSNNSWIMINWIVGYLFYGCVVGCLWGLLSNRVNHLKTFSLNDG
jgi:hypothetical protein